jgi:hypothetical protein
MRQWLQQWLIARVEIKLLSDTFKDLENIRLDENKPITSIDNVFITVLTFVSIATCYLLFKICLLHLTASNHCFLLFDQGSGPKGLENKVSTK